MADVNEGTGSEVRFEVGGNEEKGGGVGWEVEGRETFCSGSRGGKGRIWVVGVCWVEFFRWLKEADCFLGDSDHVSGF